MMNYYDLCCYSSYVSKNILNKSFDLDSCKNKDQIIYILEQSKKIYESFHPIPVSDSSSSSKLLNVLNTEFDNLILGESGEDIIKKYKGLWADTNKTWLMGNFAEAIGDYFATLDINGNCLELGAGVGATSDRISQKFTRYYRSDLFKFRNYDRVMNFNYPMSFFNLGYDYVVATNALHCATDKVKSLGYIKDILSKNGKIVLAEGEPFPDGKPFCLNNAYGLFDGWWDIGGFLSVESWLSCFTEAELLLSDLIPVKSGDIIIGHIYVAEKKV